MEKLVKDLALRDQIREMVDQASRLVSSDARARKILDIMELLFDKHDGREYMRAHPIFFDTVIRKLEEFATEPDWGQRFAPYVKIAKNMDKIRKGLTTNKLY
uniref:Uncharacterized protein n=1 Tax=Clandestinovirus TaxID=2831644 RepID=A0A8F8PR41_9VIRU|nr:hypothetical protein KOM_12_446 [Clandestinovirus]